MASVIHSHTKPIALPPKRLNLHGTVAKDQLVALVNVSEQILVIDLKDLWCAGFSTWSDEELLTVDQKNTIAGQFAQANLGTRKIGEDAHRSADLSGNSANPVVALESELDRLMRQVDTGDIHSRLDETLEHPRIIGGRPNGSNDLRSTGHVDTLPAPTIDIEPVS
jgi:hypothetical protein